MPNRPGKGPLKGGTRGKLSLSSLLGLGDPLKNVGVNDLYTKEGQDFNESLEFPLSQEEIGPRFTDERSRLFGFGPRLGRNNAERLNTLYSVEDVFGQGENSRALDLERAAQNILTNAEKSRLENRNNELIAKGPALFDANLGFNTADRYGSRLRTANAADQAATAGSELATQKARGDRQIYDEAFNFLRQGALDDASFGANRSKVRNMYGGSNAGMENFFGSLASADQALGIANDKNRRIELGSGEAVYDPRGIFFNPGPSQIQKTGRLPDGTEYPVGQPSIVPGQPTFDPIITPADIEALYNSSVGAIPQVSSGPSRRALIGAQQPQIDPGVIRLVQMLSQIFGPTQGGQNQSIQDRPSVATPPKTTPTNNTGKFPWGKRENDGKSISVMEHLKKLNEALKPSYLR